MPAVTHDSTVPDAGEGLAVLAERLRTCATTATELTTGALDRIRADNSRLNAVVTLLADAALRDARQADAEIRAGAWRGPLHGIPVGVKDIVDTAGVRTAVGSDFFRDRVPGADAEVVRRLRAAGAIVVGKLHTHEFAYGPTGDTSVFGPVRNPHDPARIAGGSSGGSAAAVATGMCVAALGSDTGGSIRIPAALCGVVGLKPTFGLVSRHGVFPLSWTLDHVGPITRTVRDNALVLAALAGHDGRDPGSCPRPPEDFARDLDAGVRGLRLGVPEDYYFTHVHADVERGVRDALRRWEDLGAVVQPVTVPDLDRIRDAHRVVVAVEAYSVHRARIEQEPGRFSDSVRQRLTDSLSITAWEYADAVRMRPHAQSVFDAVLRDVDALVTPSIPLPAPLLGQVETDAAGLDETVRSALTRLPGPTNLTGHPGLSVPCGWSRDGLPVGLQLIGRFWDEATLYRLGHALETAAA